MIRSSLKYVRQNAVAFLALFVALSGTAFAAGLAPNSVGTKQLKRGAVTGVKVKKNTLTGKQINESKLKRVPDSSKLGGLPGSAFLLAGGIAANADKLDGIDSKVFGTALTVPGTAFTPRAPSGGTTKSYVGSGEITAVGGTGEFQYTVNLPQGARITGLDYRFQDTDAGSNSSLELVAFNSIGANGPDSYSLVTASSTGSAAGRRSSSATPDATEIIDNTKWSYVLAWSPFVIGANLVGGRINYVLPTS
jgi:hypothetical protein